MNWKNILKILSISVVAVVVILAGLMIWGLSKLPSAFQIKQSITPPALKEVAKVEVPDVTEEGAVQDENSTDLSPKAKESGNVLSSSDPALRQQAVQVLLEDFMDSRRPLVEACRSMARASDSGFLKDAQNASGRYFFRSLAGNEKDPLSETAAPALRLIFRAPGMSQMIDMILKSDETQDPSLVRKAEFYYEIYRAGSYLKSHVEELNQTLQQSYNLHHLMKAVAKKPELASSPQVMSFCEDLEKNLNDGEAFDADQSAQEMQSFLEQNGIKSDEIGFDPKYRSKVELNISNTQLNVNDAWIAQLFAADIQKAMKEKKNR